MIFCKFISGTKLGDESAGTVVHEHDHNDDSDPSAVEAATYAASDLFTVGRLRRLMAVSSSRLVGSKGRNTHQVAANCSDTTLPTTAQQDNNETTTDKSELIRQPVGESITQQPPPPPTPPPPTPPSRRPKDWQLECKYTLSEVQQHSSLDDCWMVIFDKVYNITEFVDEHPGGDFILLEYAGRDATHPFLSSRHGSSAYKMLDKYWIGILVDEELYYSNNSSYCSVYSNLSWRRSTPTLEDSGSVLAANASPTDSGCSSSSSSSGSSTSSEAN